MYKVVIRYQYKNLEPRRNVTTETIVTLVYIIAFYIVQSSQSAASVVTNLPTNLVTNRCVS